MHGLAALGLSPIRFHFGLVAAARPLPAQVEVIEPGFSKWVVDNFLNGLETTVKDSA
ncbi:TetR family transcriptional regulator [Corynebacterium glutamicum ZL-6]|nr:TetR family transcriptional regulator [[Brevibacterium] flavum ZL-1]ANR66587.1 TetR family transcriptional regulator [Corynebacterium glutamicum ZL-6]PST74480.1 TetR family transcriptional regulator [Corynebacterium glutamicum ZL-2]